MKLLTYLIKTQLEHDDEKLGKFLKDKFDIAIMSDSDVLAMRHAAADEYNNGECEWIRDLAFGRASDVRLSLVPGFEDADENVVYLKKTEEAIREAAFAGSEDENKWDGELEEAAA